MKKKIKVKKHIAVSLAMALGLAVTVFVIMLLFNVTDYGITIASFGASVFMILSRKGISTKKVFGAYLVAVVIGYFASSINFLGNLNVAVAAVTSVILMTLMELQHAPAIGMAVATVLNKFSLSTDIVVVFCIFIILYMTLLLKYVLREPQKVMKFIDIEEEKIKWKFTPKQKPDYIKI
ncbi:HPP family protein [Candidatus Woesearchaeota archaeon]|nr:HPP family protein [Candidatus Woesearchaeota archaeon]